MTFTGLLQKLLGWVLPRPGLVLGISITTAFASVFAAAMLMEVQTDQLELISQKHPLIALSDRLDSFNFHGKKTFAVVVRAVDKERAIEFVDALVARVKNDPKHFQDVFYRIDPEQFKKWVLYYLSKNELIQIKDRIEQNSSLVQSMADNPDLINFFSLVNREMASRMVSEFFTGFIEDDSPKDASEKQSEPMDLDFLIKVLDGISVNLSGNSKFISPWASFFQGGAWDLSKEGYIWEGKKKFLIAAVMPAKIKDGVSKTQTSLLKLREYIQDLKATSFPDIDAGVTGQEALNNDEMHTAMRDMTLATWLSLLGVVIVLISFLRGFRHPFILTASLAVGLCWTFGWTAIFIGHLNILSIVFAPLLCGLGVDYGIHWFARFEEERDLAKGNRPLAIRQVMDKSGPGIVIAGLSTAFSFMPFILTGFRGLMELGMITGMGILFTLIADLTVLPSLCHYFASDKPAKRPLPDSENRHLFSIGRKGVYSVIAAAVLLCILGGISALRVDFDLNPLRLQSQNAEAVKWEKILVENAEHSVLSVAALADSPEHVKTLSEKLLAQQSVLDISTVFTLLPQDQEAKVPILRSILARVPDINQSGHRVAEGAAYASLKTQIDAGVDSQYSAQMVDILKRIQFKMQADQADRWGASIPVVEQMNRVRQKIDEIVNLLRSPPEAASRLSDYRDLFRDDIVEKWSFLKESSGAPPMQVQDLPPPIKDQFLQNGEFLIRIYPKDSIWDEDALARFITEVQSVAPNAVGDPVSLFVFSSAFKKASIAASIYALIAIILLHTYAFRSVKLMLLSLVPLLAGVLWTVGIMGITGFDFNLANSIFMPLVVGAGVEYGVIILSRWQEGRISPGKLPFSTGKGVILAAMTTTIGFGMLMISNHRGIFSLGFVAWAGSICVLISALFVLPAILACVKVPPDK